MNRYIVEIEEILLREVIIEAGTNEEAEQIARDLYLNEKIILTNDDFYNVSFSSYEYE